MTDSPPLEAAVALVEGENDTVLCVYNRRYGGWALPGGLREPNETPELAVARELFEETGLVARQTNFLARLPVPEHLRKPGRGTEVVLYRVLCEPGVPETATTWIGPAPEETPTTWMTKASFLRVSPFAEIYRPIFADASRPPLGPLAEMRVQLEIARHALRAIEAHFSGASDTLGRLAWEMARSGQGDARREDTHPAARESMVVMSADDLRAILMRPVPVDVQENAAAGACSLLVNGHAIATWGGDGGEDPKSAAEEAARRLREALILRP